MILVYNASEVFPAILLGAFHFRQEDARCVATKVELPAPVADAGPDKFGHGSQAGQRIRLKDVATSRDTILCRPVYLDNSVERLFLSAVPPIGERCLDL